MARRIRTASDAHVNGDSAPSSTLAAQIVQNQSRLGTSEPQDGTTATFPELLHALLHGDTEQENDVNVNASLITVVTTGGLGKLLTDNPFEDWDKLLDLAAKSLQLIEVTLKRQPAALLVQLDPREPIVLLNWLVTLLAVSFRPQHDRLPIRAVLTSALAALDTSADDWSYARVLQEVIQECIDDGLSALEDMPTAHAALSIRLPPARSIAKLWPNSESSIAMPQGSQIAINDIAKIFDVLLDLSLISSLRSAWQDETHFRFLLLASKVKGPLRAAGIWDRIVEKLMKLSRNWPLLKLLLQEAANSNLNDVEQKNLAGALINSLQSQVEATNEILLTQVRLLGKRRNFERQHEDLRIAIAVWLCHFEPVEDLPDGVRELGQSVQNGNAMMDSELHLSVKHLSTPYACERKRDRRRTKRKNVRTDISDEQKQATRLVARLLLGTDTTNLTALPQVAFSNYATLDEDQQCDAWQALIDLADYDLTSTCETVARLLQPASRHDPKKPRILSLLAIQACVQQSSDPEYTSLGDSQFGKYCIQHLSSSARELRIAAGEMISSFLRHDLPENIREVNRRLALDAVKRISDHGVENEQETLIIAWGQIAISCSDAELALVLVQLLDYLGHTNMLIRALSFGEIENVAAFKKKSVKDLLQPFWKDIVLLAVNDMCAKPQKIEELCLLTGTTLNDLLINAQQVILPHMIVNKKRDILLRIAAARGNNESILDVCMHPRTNLASVLAKLLAQTSANAEESAMACLVEMDPAFGGRELSSLIKMDAGLVAVELLKNCGDEVESKKSRAYQAFQLFANIAEAAPGQRRHSAKSSRAVPLFFENQILGILTHFSTVLEDASPNASDAEKTRCLRGLAELFTLSKGKVSYALPQIRACLQAGLEQIKLCEVAFLAWLTLIPLLQPDDIISIVEETFVLVVRYWNALSTETQRKTHDTISQLVKTHNTLLTENIMTLPSLKDIPLLSKFAAEFDRLKSLEGAESHYKAFTRRLSVDSDVVVMQALGELVSYLEDHQEFLHDAAASENPSSILAHLLCSLLNVTVRFSSTDPKAAELCGKALGLIGAVDPNRVEANRKKRQLLVLSNFDEASETIDWVLALLEDVLVKSFKSVTNAREQGFLAYTIQELLHICNLREATGHRLRSSQVPGAHQRWRQLPEHVQSTLTPFLTSRYVVTAHSQRHRSHQGFFPDASHGQWLRSFTVDLMYKAKGDNAKGVFPLLARTIKGHDLATARFVLPYAVLNVVVGGTVAEISGISEEFRAILTATPTTPAQQECIRLSSEAVFAVLEHLSTWLREKRASLAEMRATAYRTGQSQNEFEEDRCASQIGTIQDFLASIPAEIIANQAVECRSYARALFHWEQYIRQEGALIPSGRLTDKAEIMYDRLQDIYSQIDEPDGLEGIAAHLPLITEEQQAFNHAKAGRWTAAQAWYELQLAGRPDEIGLQHNVLRCLRETGQYAPLLRYANTFLEAAQGTENKEAAVHAHVPFAVEACWMTEDLDLLQRHIALRQPDDGDDFNVSIGSLLLRTSRVADGSPLGEIKKIRRSITEGLSMAGTDSLAACHEEMLKLHVLYELEALTMVEEAKIPAVLQTFDKRLNALGSATQDKQFVLGLRRAVIRLRSARFQESRSGPMWLTTARLARQTKNMSSAYNAVLKAFDCGNRGAKLEEARLLWHDGHQRQAIQALQAALDAGMFFSAEAETDSLMSDVTMSVSANTAAEINGHRQDMLTAKASLLLAKWLDASGQSQTKDMTERYQIAARCYQRWEKGHYYLGKHYSKLLDAQKALPKGKQSQPYLTGELTKLVIDNSLRSIPFGNKYWHETIPRVLTLWLELGAETCTRQPKEDQATFDKRAKSLVACNRQLQKYFDRVPPYVFYHALPQLISRIAHPHPEVWKQLANILTRIATTHPNQALWSLLPVTKANDRTRAERGHEILSRMRDPKNKIKGADASPTDLRNMIGQGLRLCDGLLEASEAAVDGRAVHVSLSKDLKFNHKLAPSQLVVPIAATLAASSPSAANCETIRRHKAFAHEKITIQSFTDDVLVLSSLQRPKKITARGSDGRLYGLLCKPKDDLRKDQRLMEFNSIINRALKRDTESSKRRLYIRTYAVTPLSEESGTLEWVEGIKPLRDILLALYMRKGIRPNYTEIKKDLDVASSAEENAHVFAKRVLPQFPACLHEWFTETYPAPEAWFAARLRYARSAAVMSMVGHVLGLGDRHGENILLEEGSGGVFHVDFNCLFDKGLTFEKPEMVPFRLTHNMVDAMGPYGYEGPFRKSSELTLGLLRQERDTLMTVLETFLYDPTTDFVGSKKKRNTAPGVPETPGEILEMVATKLKGLLRGETVPLSIEGYVDALIQEATSHFRLASMYIGWCSFL